LRGTKYWQDVVTRCSTPVVKAGAGCTPSQLPKKVNDMPAILVLLPSHKHNIHVDVDASNQRLFSGRKLGQSRRHGPKVELIIRGEEIRLPRAAFRILSIATATDAVRINLHLKPTLLASTTVFHLVIVKRSPELAEGSLIQACNKSNRGVRFDLIWIQR
jgi:hypothetical protein